MLRPQDLLCPRPEGLYCAPGDFYIDPVRPVARAVITHGHADHARSGHDVVVATPATLDIMRVRYGEDFARATEPVAYGASIARDGVEVGLVPAGHVLGSAQAVVRWRGMSIVVSGDYKRRTDPTCAPFEPVPADVFVTEATFGLPVFAFPEPEAPVEELLASVRRYPERSHLIGAYALGKAQRIIRLLRLAGHEETIYVHGALLKLNALYEQHGVPLGRLEAATGQPKAALKGAIVVAPPSTLQDRWSRRFPEPVTCFASGWMAVRARVRQKNVELPLVISDHADWNELTATVGDLRPGELWITHGREEALARWAELEGLSARPLRLVGYEDEEED